MSISPRTADFDYALPADLIARTPAPERDRSRLLILDRKTGALRHGIFRDLPEHLVSGDLLVINDAKVLPMRLFGRSERGHAVEMLLLHEIEVDCWEALIKHSKKVQVGDRLVLADGKIEARVLEKRREGRHLLHFSHDGGLHGLLWQFGQMPLPPYIKRQRSAVSGQRSAHEDTMLLEPDSSALNTDFLDRKRYQTIYARHEGAVAAPTAGLHFTPGLIETLKNGGIAFAAVTLYVGPGTFQPVRVERVEQHRMEPERYVVPEGTALAIKSAKREGRRVIAVGTTTVRALEDAAHNGDVRAGAGMADIFIYPGYRFKVIDALITNFHLPRSTLLMLVSAFAGRDTILTAYREAITRRYRFYSYGDAMLIA
ncbi:MAG: S-adenosylmethionine:tRNA ribosyltransferase-isomerase [candidate division NC10 bacterium]|nr:S-adenosylmethionine:tRNA ribosyltransferase-isomerase [candidate division NC10 bacterium]